MALNVTKGSIVNNTVSGTAPASPHIGDTWFDSTAGYLKVYNGAAWIATSQTDGTTPTVLENTTSDPASPDVGQIWIRTDL